MNKETTSVGFLLAFTIMTNCNWGLLKELSSDAYEFPDERADMQQYLEFYLDDVHEGSDVDQRLSEAGDELQQKLDVVDGPEVYEPEVEEDYIAFCGNGVVDSGEDCDDGNSDNTDDCLNDCTNARCGDGFVHSGVEECDDLSEFCDHTTCEFKCPQHWIKCATSDGSYACLLVEDWGGNHNFNDFEHHCIDLANSHGPSGYRYVGLAVINDSAIWDCTQPYLVSGRSYWIGLREVGGDGNWRWVASTDGSYLTDVIGAHSSSGPVSIEDDNCCGTPPIECGRIVQWDSSGCLFKDYSCMDNQRWSGICMIRF